MNPLARILARVIVSGVGIAAKAFMEALQQAARQSAQHGGAQKAAETVARRFDRRMAVTEARQVLNVKETATPEDIEQSFERMFASNEVEKGGSFYLQSKIYRAKERLLEELGHSEPSPGEESKV